MAKLWIETVHSAHEPDDSILDQIRELHRGAPFGVVGDFHDQAQVGEYEFGMCIFAAPYSGKDFGVLFDLTRCEGGLETVGIENQPAEKLLFAAAKEPDVLGGTEQEIDRVCEC